MVTKKNTWHSYLLEICGRWKTDVHPVEPQWEYPGASTWDVLLSPVQRVCNCLEKYHCKFIQLKIQAIISQNKFTFLVTNLPMYCSDGEIRSICQLLYIEI